eukprot:9813962-Alexandrium_andersonii.AAC.1
MTGPNVDCFTLRAVHREQRTAMPRMPSRFKAVHMNALVSALALLAPSMCCLLYTSPSPRD